VNSVVIKFNFGDDDFGIVTAQVIDQDKMVVDRRDNSKTVFSRATD